MKTTKKWKTTSKKMEDNFKKTKTKTKQWKTTSPKKMEEDLKKYGRRPQFFFGKTKMTT